MIEREHKVHKGTRRLVAILTVVAALALAPAAFAQSTGTGYGGIAGQTAQGSKDKSGVAANNGNDGTAATQATSSNGVLAFTGLDLALLAGGGLVLLGSGLALSRLVGRSSAA